MDIEKLIKRIKLENDLDLCTCMDLKNISSEFTRINNQRDQLLEALEEITMYCLSMREHGHLGSGCEPYVEKAKDAIAAAKGEV